MSKPYKLPRCFIGQPIDGGGVITEDMCNPECHCLTPIQAFFCMEGHMTECHAGMSCNEAECSHLERYQDPDDSLAVSDDDIDVEKLDDESLMRACDVEMESFQEVHGYVKIEIQLKDLLAVIGMAQLALRHPGVVGPTRTIVEEVIDRFSRELCDYPAMTELIRRGNSTPKEG